jgi:hypothetical protein
MRHSLKARATGSRITTTKRYADGVLALRRMRPIASALHR